MAPLSFTAANSTSGRGATRVSLCVSQEQGWVLNTKAVDNMPEGQAPPVPPARTLPHSREQAALGLGARCSDSPQAWLDPWSCRHVAPPTPAGRQHRAAWALSLPIQAVGVWGLSGPGTLLPCPTSSSSPLTPSASAGPAPTSHMANILLHPGAAGFPAQPSPPLSPQLFPSSTSFMPLISD